MKKWHIIAIVLVLLLVAAVCFRWPRLEPDMVTISRSEILDDQMIFEYRMNRPFDVALNHGIRMPTILPETPDISIEQPPRRRSQRIGLFPSKYDFLRGEHYVLLHFKRGDTLFLAVNDQPLEIAAWSVPDAKNVKWIPPGDNLIYGQGVGIGILLFSASENQEEYIMSFAGADNGRSVN